MPPSATRAFRSTRPIRRTAAPLHRARHLLLTLATPVALFSAGVPLPSHAQSGIAQTRAVSLPAGALGPSLTALTRAFGVSLTVDSALVSGLRAPAVEGSLSLQQALQVLLTGSGLAAHIQEDQVVVRSIAPGARTELAPVRITGVPDAGERRNVGRMLSYSDNLPIPIEKQPRSISVLTEELLDQQQSNALGLGNLLRNVSSASSTANGELASFITLRGFSAITAVDGLNNNSYVSRSLSAYERVEVVKGPSALLVGGGAPGGVVNFILKRPLDQARHVVNLGIGQEQKASNGRVFGAFDSGGPLTEHFSYRFVADGIREERFYAPTDPDKTGLLYGALSWKLSPATRFNAFLSTENQSYNSGRLAGQPASGTVRPNGAGIRVPIEQVFTDRSQRYRTTDNFFRLEWQQRLSQQWLLETSYQYLGHSEFRDISFPSALAANQTNLTVGLSRYLQNWVQHDNLFTSKATGEFKIGGFDNLLVAGVQYRTQTVASPATRSGATQVSLANPVLDLSDASYTAVSAGSSSGLKQKSLFVQDQFSLTSTVNLFGGVRFDSVDQRSQVNNGTAPRLAASQDKATYNLGVGWNPIAPLNLYASFNTAFEPTSPGANDASGILYKPQQTRQAEVGAKFGLAPNLLATVAAFEIVRSNVLTPDPNNALFSVQTGEVRSRGIELELNGEITRGWNLLAAYTHLDAEITRDNTAVQGNAFANIPRNAARLFTTYRFTADSAQGFGVGGGITYRSQRFADNANTLVLPSYTLVDLLGWYDVNARTRVQLNVSNLFDREFYANGRNALRVYPGAPRTVLLSLRHNFH